MADLSLQLEADHIGVPVQSAAFLMTSYEMAGGKPDTSELSIDLQSHFRNPFDN
jgi:hypothetical protein